MGVSDPANPLDLDALAQGQIAMLQELAEMAMRAARIISAQIEVQAQAGAESAALKDLSLSLDRTARVVRRTLALQKTLAFDRDALIREHQAAAARVEKAAEAAAVRQTEAEARGRQESCNTFRAADAVADLVQREIDHINDAERAEALFDDLYDRCENADLEDNRPIPEIIAEICQALGLTPDWSFWAGEDWMVDPSSSPMQWDEGNRPP